MVKFKFKVKVIKNNKTVPQRRTVDFDFEVELSKNQKEEFYPYYPLYSSGC